MAPVMLPQSWSSPSLSTVISVVFLEVLSVMLPSDPDHIPIPSVFWVQDTRTLHEMYMIPWAVWPQGEGEGSSHEDKTQFLCLGESLLLLLSVQKSRSYRGAG